MIFFVIFCNFRTESGSESREIICQATDILAEVSPWYAFCVTKMKKLRRKYG